MGRVGGGKKLVLRVSKVTFTARLRRINILWKNFFKLHVSAC